MLASIINLARELDWAHCADIHQNRDLRRLFHFREALLRALQAELLTAARRRDDGCITALPKLFVVGRRIVETGRHLGEVIENTDVDHFSRTFFVARLCRD